MDPATALSLGVPGVLLAGLIAVWNEWQRDRKKSEESYKQALQEQKEDAKAMHQMAADLGLTARTLGNINANGAKLDEVLAILKNGAIRIFKTEVHGQRSWSHQASSSHRPDDIDR
jgi:methylthioribose-1-phosphate isomerase